MNIDEFNEAMALLVATVGRAMPDEQVQAWWVMLNDLSEEELKRGIVAAIRTHEFAGFPTIGVIRKHAIGRDQSLLAITDRTAVAWAAIKRAISEQGGYATVVFDDPLVTASVRELGGWVRFCDCEAGEKFDVWLRKEFERTYTALMTAGTSAERTTPLAGLCDIANSATGHEARLQAKTIETGLPAIPARLIRGDVPKIEHAEIRRIGQECVQSLGLPDQGPSPDHTPARSRDEQIRIIKDRILIGAMKKHVETGLKVFEAHYESRTDQP